MQIPPPETIMKGTYHSSECLPHKLFLLSTTTFVRKVPRLI